MGFKLNNLGEWKMALPDTVSNIVITRIGGKIVLTFWTKDKYREWKPRDIDSAKARVDELVDNTIASIDEKNFIFRFNIDKENYEEAKTQLFTKIVKTFTDVDIKTIKRQVLRQILSQFRSQYDSSSLPITVKIDLRDYLGVEEPEPEDYIMSVRKINSDEDDRNNKQEK